MPAADATPVSAPADSIANPFFAPSELPLLAPDFTKIKDEHYLPAFENGMQEQAAQMRAIADNGEAPTFDNTIVAMERSGEVLFRVSKVFFNLTESTTNEAMQAVQAEVAPKLAKHNDSIYLDPALFARVKALYDQREALNLDQESSQLLERYFQRFVRSGAELSEADKVKLRALNEEQSTLTTQFQENLLKDTNASAVVVDSAEELAGLDPSAISAAAKAAEDLGHPGKFALTLQLPSSQGVISSLDNREIRKRVFLASINRGNNDNEFDNKGIVRRLAQLRAERASLLGYDNHAAFTLADQMAGSPEAVDKMLSELAPQIRANAEREAADMQAMIAADGADLQLQPWDWAYYAEKLRKQRYDLDESEIRPYFELERVLHDGLFFAMREIYGIEFSERKDIPVYHPNVRVFEVKDEDGNVIKVSEKVIGSETREQAHGCNPSDYTYSTIGYEVRSDRAAPDSRPAVIAETQLAAVHIEEQRLVRLSATHREYLQRWHR